ncbi:hypothetical protein [Streptomyces sp. NPDC088727]|uniref:hypothetical protein n=1 Tax=Streptomyces sp. NPDC088727 TaxID=3365875 RepID=UPI003827D66F
MAYVSVYTKDGTEYGEIEIPDDLYKKALSSRGSSVERDGQNIFLHLNELGIHIGNSEN